MRTHECDDTTRQGRLRKAIEFAEAAQALDDLADDAENGNAITALRVLSGLPLPM